MHAAFSFGSNGALLPRSATSSMRLEQAAPAHVADEGMIAEALVQASRQMRALLAHIGQQIVAPDHALHSERRRAGERMTHVGVAVLERARAFRERLEDRALTAAARRSAQNRRRGPLRSPSGRG